MQNNIYGYAFDIEGTLYDKGKLQRGVVKLFDAITKTNKPIVFVSGMNFNEISQIVNIIKQKIHQPMSYYIASNTGAYITNQTEQIISQHYISNDELDNIEKIVHHYPDTIILYRSNTFNFVTTQPNDGKYRLNNLDKITHSNRHYNIIDISTAQSIKQSKQIFSIEITTHNDNILNEIYTQISSAFDGHVLLLGNFIQISHGTKWLALRSLFDQNAYNICYFGDGLNDIECLTNCNAALLTNSHLPQMYELIQDFGTQNKFATCDLGKKEIIKYVTEQEYDTKTMQTITQKTKQKMI